MKPDKRIEATFPLLEFLSIDEPFASGSLSLLACIIMIRRWVRRGKPKVDLLPKFICNDKCHKAASEGDRYMHTRYIVFYGCVIVVLISAEIYECAIACVDIV